MTDLNSLMIFAHVAEAQSFSEAARRLRMPLASVSRRIADLEDDLGVRLLERSTRKIRLTQIGLEVVVHARDTIKASDDVAAIVSNHQAALNGTLRLAAPLSVSGAVLSPIIQAFQNSYPDVRISVLVLERNVDYFADSVDLAFHVGPLKSSSLIARRLLTYRHRLVASPAYLAQSKMPSTPQELLSHRTAVVSSGEPLYSWEFTHVGNKEKQIISPNPHLSTNDFAGLTPALLGGQGIGEISPLTDSTLIRDGQLVEVLPDWHLPPKSLSLIHLSRRLIPEPVRIFKEFAAAMTRQWAIHLPMT